jgi:hypothetical protein
VLVLLPPIAGNCKERSSFEKKEYTNVCKIKSNSEVHKKVIINLL